MGPKLPPFTMPDIQTYDPRWNSYCQCTACAQLRRGAGQPAKEDFVEQVLDAVRRKYSESDKKPQVEVPPLCIDTFDHAAVIEAGDMPITVSCNGLLYKIAAGQSVSIGAIKQVCQTPAPKAWARDAWIAEHEQQIAGSDKPAGKERWWVQEFLYQRNTAETDNAYFDRVAAAAHNRRALNWPREDGSDIIKERRNRSLGKAMQQPIQSDLPLNEQILSARYGRSQD